MKVSKKAPAMGDDLELLDPNEKKPTEIETNNSRAGLRKTKWKITERSRK